MPDHTTISRRAAKLGKIPFYDGRDGSPVHILVDCSGLRVHTGAMRKPPKSRDWRKLHLALDAKTGVVIACDLTRKGVKDSSRVPALVGKVEQSMASLTADAAYDERLVYEAAQLEVQGCSSRQSETPSLAPEWHSAIAISEHGNDLASGSG